MLVKILTINIWIIFTIIIRIIPHATIIRLIASIKSIIFLLVIGYNILKLITKLSNLLIIIIITLIIKTWIIIIIKIVRNLNKWVISVIIIIVIRVIIIKNEIKKYNLNSIYQRYFWKKIKLRYYQIKIWLIK